MQGVELAVAFTPSPLAASLCVIRNFNNRGSFRDSSTYAMVKEVLILDSTTAYRDSIFMTSDGWRRVVLLINVLNWSECFSVGNELACPYHGGRGALATQRRIQGLNPGAVAC